MPQTLLYLMVVEKGPFQTAHAYYYPLVKRRRERERERERGVGWGDREEEEEES